jgi:hypothetical protein
VVYQTVDEARRRFGLCTADLSQPVSPQALAFRRSSNPKRSQTQGRPESVGKKFAARRGTG